MCIPTPKAPPAPPPPPPPAPPAPIAELRTDDDGASDPNDPAGMKKGRKKLRIDLAGGTTAGEGSGLNIPS